jgi:uncharacterized protein (TIGR02996 family)
MKKVFVIMPFEDQFDDVYHIIRDSGNKASTECNIELQVFRADDISDPGRISMQVLDAIRESDMVIADLTGSNPNVMYELGYAHALEKTVVLLNQAVHESPFDVKDFRQIVYDRSRLLRDCQVRLVTAIKTVVGSASVFTDEHLPENDNMNEGSNNAGATIRRPGAKVVAELQAFHIDLQMHNSVSNSAELRKVGAQVRSFVDTITIIGRADGSDAKNTAGSIGNCAVELEKGEEYVLAEEIFGRAIGLFPDHGGLRLQYADFLFDQGQENEAQVELVKAKKLSPDDARISKLEMKFSAQGGCPSEEIGYTLKHIFESDPSSDQNAAMYLAYLSKIDDAEDEFQTACELWERSVSDDRKIVPKRAMADFLATRNPERSIAIYESFIEDAAMSEGDRHDMLHNMATLYSNKGDKEMAMKSWRRAYKIDRHDSTVNASFSQRLALWNEFELAKKVIQGLPLDE